MSNITFRSPQLSDLEQMLDLINTLSKEETFIRKQGYQFSQQEEKEYLVGLLKKTEEKKTVNLLAFDGELLVGSADVVSGVGAEQHVGLFGIILRKEYRNKGIGTMLMKKILAETQKNIENLEIITLSVFSDNKPAIHLYQKLGFKQYGLLPNGVMRKGKYADSIEMYFKIDN